MAGAERGELEQPAPALKESLNAGMRVAGFQSLKGQFSLCVFFLGYVGLAEVEKTAAKEFILV